MVVQFSGAIPLRLETVSQTLWLENDVTISACMQTSYLLAACGRSLCSFPYAVNAARRCRPPMRSAQSAHNSAVCGSMLDQPFLRYYFAGGLPALIVWCSAGCPPQAAARGRKSTGPSVVDKCCSELCFTNRRHPRSLKRGWEIRLEAHLKTGAKSGMRAEEELIGLR